MHAANTHYKGVPYEDELEPPSKEYLRVQPLFHK